MRDFNNPEVFLNHLKNQNLLSLLNNENPIFLKEEELFEEETYIETEVISFYSKSLKEEKITVRQFVEIMLPLMCISLLFFQPSVAVAADQIKQQTKSVFDKSLTSNLLKGNKINPINPIAKDAAENVIKKTTKKVGKTLKNKAGKILKDQWIFLKTTNPLQTFNSIRKNDVRLEIPISIITENLPIATSSNVSKLQLISTNRFYLLFPLTSLVSLRAGGGIGGLGGVIGAIGTAGSWAMKVLKIAKTVSDVTTPNKNDKTDQSKQPNTNTNNNYWPWEQYNEGNTGNQGNQQKTSNGLLEQLGGTLGVLGSFTNSSVPTFMLLWYLLHTINQNQTKKSKQIWGVPNFPLPIPVIRLREKTVSEKLSEFMYSIFDFNSPIIYVIIFTAILLWWSIYGRTNPLMESVKFANTLLEELMNAYKGENAWFKTQSKKNEDEARTAQDELRKENKANLKKAEENLAECNNKVENAKNDCIRTNEDYNIASTSVQSCHQDLAAIKAYDTMLIRAIDSVQEEFQEKIPGGVKLRDLANARLSDKRFQAESEKVYRKLLADTREVYPISIHKKSWFEKTWESVLGRGEDNYQKVTHRKVVHGGSPFYDWLFGPKSSVETVDPGDIGDTGETTHFKNTHKIEIETIITNPEISVTIEDNLKLIEKIQNISTNPPHEDTLD